MNGDLTTSAVGIGAADEPRGYEMTDLSPVEGGVAAVLMAQIEALKAESAELTKALTGLTCGGSEFFIRRDGRNVADIKACVDWVQRRDRDAHGRHVAAVYKLRDAEKVSAIMLGAIQGALSHCGPNGYLDCGKPATDALRTAAQASATSPSGLE